MTIALIVGALLLALILLWCLWLREWLKTRPSAVAFFAWIEPIEAALYKKSETILWARLQQVGGLTLTTLQLVGSIDPTPFLPVIPERHRTWVGAAPGIALAVNGVICERLRRRTTKPLEVVALPDAMPPHVAEAVAVAEQAKIKAVEVVKQAQQEKQI